MGRARKTVDGDDDDEMPRGPGRPRAPEIFGPPKPLPHQRSEYARRVQAVLDAIEIPQLDVESRLYLQRTLRIHDVLRTCDPTRFKKKGEEEVTLLLRVVFESKNGVAALTLPILQAVGGCMHPGWVGLRLFDAYDAIDLVALHGQLCDLGIEDQLERALRTKLTQILGPPIVSQPQTDPKPARKMALPKDVSAAWEAALAIHKATRRPSRQSQRRAAMAA